MENIRKLLDEDKLIIGSKVVIKKLNNNLIEKVFIAKNCKPETKNDINKLAKLSGIETTELDMSNDELGTYCRKPFHISVVGVLKN
jgi:large subunit ribosomal protein L30e